MWSGKCKITASLSLSLSPYFSLPLLLSLFFSLALSLSPTPFSLFFSCSLASASFSAMWMLPAVVVVVVVWLPVFHGCFHRHTRDKCHNQSKEKKERKREITLKKIFHCSNLSAIPYWPHIDCYFYFLIFISHLFCFLLLISVNYTVIHGSVIGIDRIVMHPTAAVASNEHWIFHKEEQKKTQISTELAISSKQASIKVNHLQ